MPEGRKTPLVSMIMPAYNAGEYIERSVRSVLAQSYGALELIVIDDGSKDDTAQLLARIAREDGRLRPVTVENGGPALARNKGLSLVDPGAEYVMFIDADDELLPDALDYALKGAAGADLVLFGFSIVGTDGGARHYFEPEQRLSRPDLGEALARLYKANLLNQVWAKLYKAELLRGGMAFQDYRWGEDRLFVFDCLEKAKSVQVLPECKYRYVMHKGESLITKYYDKKFQVCLEADARVERLCGELGVEADADFRYMFMKSVFSCLTNLFSDSCTLSGAEKRKAVREIIGNERVRRRSRGASGGLPTEVLCAVIRSGSTELNLLAFHLLALSGKLAPGLFMKLKHRK